MRWVSRLGETGARKLKISPLNILLIVVALEVSQPPSGWFNAQLTSIHEKSWTLDTSHLPIGWLNTRAPWNIACMFVTLDTSHALMSPLNAKFL